jgi:hypothetical protein
VKGEFVHSDQTYHGETPAILFRTHLEDLSLDTGELDDWAFWDYRIERSGPHGIADGSTILAMKLDQVEQQGNPNRTWMVLKPLREKDNVYERIGLLRPDIWGNSPSAEGNILDEMHQQDPTEMELTIC